MESDGVLTFEKFKVFESDEFKITSIIQCLYKGIGKTDIKAEKFLADHFDANLSQIDIVDTDKHMFKISNWENEDLLVIVYNKDEFDIIKENIKEHLYDELLKQQIDLIVGVSLKLNTIIDKDKFNTDIESKLTDNLITDLINDSLEMNYTNYSSRRILHTVRYAKSPHIVVVLLLHQIGTLLMLLYSYYSYIINLIFFSFFLNIIN